MLLTTLVVHLGHSIWMLDNMIEILEHESSNYAPRTKFNGKISDVTIAFAYDLDTHGEKLTKKCAGSKYIGFQLNEILSEVAIVKEIYGFLLKKKAKTINIAGNGIYTLKKYGCNQKTINLFLYTILKKVHYHYPIEKVYTGGQTGVDLAGAVSAYLLGIDVVMTLPNGFKQRFDDGTDVFQTKEDIILKVEHWVNLLMEDVK